MRDKINMLALKICYYVCGLLFFLFIIAGITMLLAIVFQDGMILFENSINKIRTRRYYKNK